MLDWEKTTMVAGMLISLFQRWVGIVRLKSPQLWKDPSYTNIVISGRRLLLPFLSPDWLPAFTFFSASGYSVMMWFLPTHSPSPRGLGVKGCSAKIHAFVLSSVLSFQESVRSRECSHKCLHYISNSPHFNLLCSLQLLFGFLLFLQLPSSNPFLFPTFSATEVFLFSHCGFRTEIPFVRFVNILLMHSARE